MLCYTQQEKVLPIRQTVKLFIEKERGRRMILSLQGCMAVGKTTAARYLQEHLPDVHVSLEYNTGVIEEVRRRRLNKNRYGDYLEIQKLWLQNEVARWQDAQRYPHTVMDFGAEEIEFYTLNYSKSCGLNWRKEDIEQALRPELIAVRQCMPEHILFLDASEAVLRARKAGDSTRSREFFEHYVAHLLPLKRAWFREKSNVTFLQTDGLTAEEAGEKAKRWCETCIQTK